MRFKGTHFFTAIVIALVSYTYLFEYKKSMTEEIQSEEAKKILTLKKEEVDQILIETKAEPLNTKILIKKEKGSWVIQSPIQDFASDNDIGDWLNSIFGEKAVEVIKPVEGPIQWPSYGLDSPKFKLVLTGQNLSQTLEVSEKKNFEGNSFMRRDGSTDLIVASGGWAGLLSKSLMDLRDKRLLRRETTQLKQVEVKTESKIQLISENGVWGFEKQKDVRLAPEAVLSFVNSIKELRVFEFANELPPSASDLKKFGLISPMIEVNFKFGDGSSWAFKANKSKDGVWFGISDDQNRIVKLQSQQPAKIFDTTPESLRDLTLPFAFNADKITKLKVEGPFSFSIEKKGDGWSWDQKEKLEQKMVPELLSQLNALRVKKFFDGKKDFPLKPEIKTSLFDESGALVVELVFGEKVSKEKDEMIWVRSSNYGDSVAIEKVSYLNLNFEKLKDSKEDLKK